MHLYSDVKCTKTNTHRYKKRNRETEKQRNRETEKQRNREKDALVGTLSKTLDRCLDCLQVVRTNDHRFDILQKVNQCAA